MWIDLLNAFVVGGVINLVIWTLFLTFRILAGLHPTYGTELFAILTTLNLTALLDMFAIREIAIVTLSQGQLRIACSLLLVATFVCVAYCLPVEKRAQDARVERYRRGDALSAGERLRLAARETIETTRVFLARWLLATLHTMWVIKVPKGLMVLQ